MDFWETKDGRIVKFTEMTTAHLRNAKRLVEKRQNELRNLLYGCDEDDIDEWCERGRMANEAIKLINNELNKRGEL